MPDFPTLQPGNYQILSELGHNSLGGRVTYLANQVANYQKVVIKQFQFAKLGANWQEYDTYEQESTMLRNLHHPSIPRYLDSFSTPDGFCLVQEYIEAVPLTTQRNWTPDGIRKLALAVLDILIYLQQQQPSIIHRDLKPENILIDAEEKVYLVDFGFARSGGGEVALSSVVKGTLGFMPPEQLFNRELSEAADLYGLGMTLICLLTGTNSVAVGNLIDGNYYVHFRHLVPSGANAWLNWLERLVEPNPQNRFANAKTAKEALQEIDLTRLPKLRLSEEKLEVKANEWGEKVSTILQVSNPIPDTLLSGRWEVAPHKHDPPHSPYDHSWISFYPRKFSSNQQVFQIEVDTSKLLAGKSYQRYLVLHSNAGEDSRVINLKVRTKSLPQLPRLHYPSLMVVAAVYFLAILLFLGVLLEIRGGTSLPKLLPNNDPLFFWLFLPFGLGILWGTFINDRLLSVANLEKIRNIYTGLGCWTFIATLFGISVASQLVGISFLFAAIGLCLCILIGESFFIYNEKHQTKSKADNRKNLIELFFALLIGYSLLTVAVYLFIANGDSDLVSDTWALIWRGCAVIFILFTSIIISYKVLANAKNKHQFKRGFTSSEASSISLLTAGLGASISATILGVYLLYNSTINPDLTSQQQLLLRFIATIPVITHCVSLSKFVIFKPRHIKRIITNYQAKKEQLIKP